MTRGKGRAVQLSSKSVEHYGPGYIGDLAHVVMGGVDLDPASCEAANRLIRAQRYYASPEDGLVLPWSGRMYINPPGGKRIGPDGYLQNQQALWFARAAMSWEDGEIDQALFMVFNLELLRHVQRYDCRHPLDSAFLTCWPKKRIDFERPTTAAERAAGLGLSVEQGSPGHPNCIVYMPPRRQGGSLFDTCAKRFVECGRALGYVPDTFDIPF